MPQCRWTILLETLNLAATNSSQANKTPNFCLNILGQYVAQNYWPSTLFLNQSILTCYVLLPSSNLVKQIRGPWPIMRKLFTSDSWLGSLRFNPTAIQRLLCICVLLQIPVSFNYQRRRRIEARQNKWCQLAQRFSYSYIRICIGL